MEKLPTLEKREKLKSQIEVKKNEKGELEDLMVIEAGKKFGLQEYLPAGVRFEDKRPIFAFSPDKKIVRFFEQLISINSAEGRLYLMHEMGHAQDFNKHPEIWKDFNMHELWFRKIKTMAVEIMLSEEYDRLPEHERRGFVEKETIEKIYNLHAPKEIEALARFLAILERNAWAEALKLYRKIKKENGVDIFQGTSNKDIIGFVNEILDNYDRLYRSFVPDQQIKLFLIKKFGRNLE